MLDLQDFKNFQMEHDYFNDREPALRLADLKPRDDSLPVLLSYCVGITDFRRSQLARTLETLARQTWKEFEVLVGDDGSTQDLKYICDLFRPYLRISYARLEREGYSCCPSRIFKHLFRIAQGQVIAIAQPELMLKSSACEFLYQAHFNNLDAYYYIIDELANEFKTGRNPTTDEVTLNRRWVTLKPGFLDKPIQLHLDHIDWHKNVAEIENMPGYWDRATGLSNRPNTYWSQRTSVPWWFCGSARADDPIWKDMPVTIGHASIDFWLLNYRKFFSFIDIMPKEVMGYHQDHVRGSISPKGEQETVSFESIRRAHG